MATLKIVAARNYSDEERAALLMRATTMAEIREAAWRLGLTFRQAYRQRHRLYAKHACAEWPEMRRLGRRDIRHQGWS